MEPVIILFVVAVGMAASLACGVGVAAALAGAARRLMQRRAPAQRLRREDVVSALRSSGGL